MTYGIASQTTEGTLAAAGLLDGLIIRDGSEDRVFEVDIVCDGALDESFQVQDEMAEDIAMVLFESITEVYPLMDIEVSVYDRTQEDNAMQVWGMARSGALA